MQKGKLKVLGQRIKSLRREKELLQVELADIVDVSTGYISSIEQGLRYPSLKVLEKIAKALKIPVSKLLE
jgi:transcriptional regulator with XRE-family HTH domain